MTNEEKIEKVIDYLTTSHLDSFGGYPFPWRRIGDSIVIASSFPDTGKVTLEVYEDTELAKWYDGAALLMAEGWGFNEAMEEIENEQS